jgi:diguanylate cyclase (GGDEF)-like protein
MHTTPRPLYARCSTALVLAALAIYTGVELVRGWAVLASATDVLLCLLLPALAAAATASRRARERPPRAALSFVLAGLALLPPPGALLLGIAAGLAGRGAGVGGVGRTGSGSFVGFAVAVAVADALAGSFSWPVDLGSPLTLLPLLFLFLVVQGFTLATGLAFEADSAGDSSTSLRAWNRAWLEAFNVPLGWMLAALLDDGAWFPALGFALLVLLAVEALVRLERVKLALGGAQRSLEARLTELGALHAIGEEILSTLDAETVFRLLDRECRKIFDVDACSVALADRERQRLRRVFSRIGDKLEIGERAVQSGLALQVLSAGRPQRIDDVRDLPREGSLQASLLDPATRSAMAAPLRVDGGVVGVFVVESRRPAAYDDHRLALLATIGQQAAVAIENARHYQMATVDSLTGFFVKEHFFRRLREEYQRARRYGGRLALLMLDLDGFKEINDGHGHLAGDRFLTDITETIRRELRRDDLACRYGGDEFCLLLPETDPIGAGTIAERIRTAVARRIVIAGGVPLRTTVSIGVAAFPEHDGGDLQSLIHNADEALYRAKRAGRDRVVPYAA